MNPKTQQWLESFPEGRTYHLHSSVRNQEPKKETNIMQLNPMQFATLAQLAHDSPILCLEGKITKLYEAKRGDGQYGPWVIQNGTISDGQLRHDIAFMTDETILPMDAEGKQVRITAQEYKSKLTGVKLTDKLVKGKSKRTIEVKYPAKVEVIGGTSQPAPRPAQSQPVPAGTTTPHSVNGGGYQQDMEPAPTNEPMEDRIDDLIKTVNLVCLAIGRDPDEMWNAASADKIIELGVGCICSFKGKYGTHSRPTFRDSAQAQATMQQQESLVDKAREVTAGLEEELPSLSWRDFQYTNKAGLNRLGDKTHDQIKQLSTFCTSNAMNTPELQALAANVAIAMDEINNGMADADIPF